MERLTEEHILAGCIKKEHKCMEMLYKQYSPSLYAIALRYTKSAEDAEDVLQDAFINIFEHIEQFSGKGSLQAWMSKIVINQALFLYQQKLRRTLVDYDDYQEMLPDESIVVSDTLTHKTLLNLIRMLPEGYRIVFNLHEIEGYQYNEIATLLNCSVSTCRSQLCKAKRVLQEAVKDFLKNESNNISKLKSKKVINS
ncbi:MAG: RNA polymerase sigma factor [Bacteroidales bacterium]|jgi:RNA polymerase sigma-70 factor (ECF subfamily)|nr:RNA polymerase sigma factor [Bacteroidales bacterium]